MLNELIPNACIKHRALPILGSLLEDFDDWLIGQGYGSVTRKCYVQRLTGVERYLYRRGARCSSDLTADRLAKAQRYFHPRPGQIFCAVSCLRRFLQAEQRLAAAPLPPPRPFDDTLQAYVNYLVDVRGLTGSTTNQHCASLRAFVDHLLANDDSFHWAKLTQDCIEGYVRSVGKAYSRVWLQHIVAHLRSFLRFLGLQGLGPLPGTLVVDAPCIYKQEQLPKALPWETVQAFLRGIARTTPSGLRDYAIFSLIAAYGLRQSEAAGLQLHDIDWKRGEIHIVQPKTRQRLTLPLLGSVAKALLAYLRKGRPKTSSRAVFFSLKAPLGQITPRAVAAAFRGRVLQSDLNIAFTGVHCLRHSYATHLLRRGVPLKTISDLLGHRLLDTTCIYLRMNFDELREAALSLPTSEIRP